LLHHGLAPVARNQFGPPGLKMSFRPNEAAMDAWVRIGDCKSSRLSAARRSLPFRPGGARLISSHGRKAVEQEVPNLYSLFSVRAPDGATERRSPRPRHQWRHGLSAHPAPVRITRPCRGSQRQRKDTHSSPAFHGLAAVARNQSGPPGLKRYVSLRDYASNHMRLLGTPGATWQGPSPARAGANNS